jgi:branched-chain amino acid transport system permease protein
VGIGAVSFLWSGRGLGRDRIPWPCSPRGCWLVVAYPCFRFRIIGHYFALVTLALSGIVLR